MSHHLIQKLYELSWYQYYISVYFLFSIPYHYSLLCVHYKTFYPTGIEPALAHCSWMCNQWATISSKNYMNLSRYKYYFSVYFLFSIPPSLFPALCSITIKPFTGLESNLDWLRWSRMCNHWATTSSKLQYIPQYKYYISVYFSFQYPPSLFPALCSITIKPFIGLESNPD
jgi:hypothetical protein